MSKIDQDPSEFVSSTKPNILNQKVIISDHPPPILVDFITGLPLFSTFNPTLAIIDHCPLCPRFCNLRALPTWKIISTQSPSFLPSPLNSPLFPFPMLHALPLSPRSLEPLSMSLLCANKSAAVVPVPEFGSSSEGVRGSGSPIGPFAITISFIA